MEVSTIREEKYKSTGTPKNAEKFRAVTLYSNFFFFFKESRGNHFKKARNQLTENPIDIGESPLIPKSIRERVISFLQQILEEMKNSILATAAYADSR